MSICQACPWSSSWRSTHKLDHEFSSYTLDIRTCSSSPVCPVLLPAKAKFKFSQNNLRSQLYKYQMMRNAYQKKIAKLLFLLRPPTGAITNAKIYKKSSNSIQSKPQTNKTNILCSVIFLDLVAALTATKIKKTAKSFWQQCIFCWEFFHIKKYN